MLQLKYDGCSIFKISTELLRPILGMLQEGREAEPFGLDLWIGSSNPINSSELIEYFVDEIKKYEPCMLENQERLVVH